MESFLVPLLTGGIQYVFLGGMILFPPALFMWLGCKFRVLPVVLMRAWWVVITVVQFLTLNLMTLLVDTIFNKILKQPDLSGRLCMFCVHFCYTASFYLTPHIKLVEFDTTRMGPEGLDQLRYGPPCALLFNHTSMYDGWTYCSFCPWRFFAKTRTLNKKALEDLPIFGPCIRRCGHFPVYFKSDEDGNFSVDKERQAPVLEKMDRFLEAGGTMAFYPEGTINRKDPKTLQDFRRGSFSSITKHKLRILYWVTTGADKVWPPNKPFGGFPADIRVALGRYEVDWNDAAMMDIPSLSDGLRAEMQKTLDELYAKDEKKTA